MRTHGVGSHRGYFTSSLFAAVVALIIIVPPALLYGQTDPSNPNTTDREIPVAVLSEDGSAVLNQIHRLHFASAQQGLRIGGTTLRARGQDWRLTPLDRHGSIDSLACVQRAEDAIDGGAVVILGAVSSSCTRWILQADLRIPVISSLSTDPDLDRLGNGWFFRTIPADDKRLEAYKASVEVKDYRGIALYEDNHYGRGLLARMEPEFDIDSTHQFRWDENTEDLGHQGIRIAGRLRAFIEGDHHRIETVFVLGGGGASERAKRLSHLMALHGHDPTFVLFIDTPKLPKFLPDKTHIVTLPLIATSGRPELVARNPNIRTDLIDYAGLLYVSTLDAARIAREAIQMVLTETSAAPGSAEFRTELRSRLESERFRTSERGRRVGFSGDFGSEVSPPPSTPIFSTLQTDSLINVISENKWIELDIRHQPERHGEGPVVIRLIGHGYTPSELREKEVTVEATGITPDPIRVATVPLTGDTTYYSFVPSFWTHPLPSRLTLRVEDAGVISTATSEEFGWPVSYPLAGGFAIMGAILFTHYRGRDSEEPRPSWSKTLRISGERCAAGLIIAVLILHVGPLVDPPAMEADSLLSYLPIPRFNSAWWMNAALSGLLGGWLGLKFIVGLVAGLISSLAPLFRHGEA